MDRGGDEAALARGVYNTYIEDNLATRKTRRWICIKK